MALNPYDYNVHHGRYGVRQSADSKIVIPTAIDIFFGISRIGFAQSLRATERRPTVLVRHLRTNVESLVPGVGLPGVGFPGGSGVPGLGIPGLGGLPGIAAGGGVAIDQIPQVPEYTVTLTRLAVYDYVTNLLNAAASDGIATFGVFFETIAQQGQYFTIKRTRRHPVTGKGYTTIWRGCMMTDYDEGEDNIGAPGTPIIETMTATALWKEVIVF